MGIVAAVGISANTTAKGQPGKERAALIQAAMEQAVRDASAEGLQVDKDASVIRERMMEARQKVIESFGQVPLQVEIPAPKEG